MRERQMRERSADSSGVHLWLVLMKAHRSMVRHAERSIVSLDMCISDFGVLEVLLHRGPQSVSEIGRRVDLTSGSITTAIDRLETRGLVVRAADAGDLRGRGGPLTRPRQTPTPRTVPRHTEPSESSVRRTAERRARTPRPVTG